MAVELYYREEGSGAPLLVLHGLFGSSSNWARLARGLAAEFRVICADLRNHGRSPHAAGMSYPQMAADVVALLDRLRLDRVALLGHSMGGKVAMQVALNQPERVSRLLVADIAPRAYRGNQAIVLEALEALHLDSLASRREADERLAAQVPETGVRAFLLTNLTQEQGRFGWRINLPEIIDGIEAIEAFPVSAGAGYPGPVQFLAGALSDYVRDDDLPGIRALFPRAEVAWLEQAGHWLHAEQPAAFLAAARRFLAAG